MTAQNKHLDLYVRLKSRLQARKVKQLTKIIETQVTKNTQIDGLQKHYMTEIDNLRQKMELLEMSVLSRSHYQDDGLSAKSIAVTNLDDSKSMRSFQTDFRTLNRSPVNREVAIRPGSITLAAPQRSRQKMQAGTQAGRTSMTTSLK